MGEIGFRFSILIALSPSIHLFVYLFIYLIFFCCAETISRSNSNTCMLFDTVSVFFSDFFINGPHLRPFNSFFAFQMKFQKGFCQTSHFIPSHTGIKKTIFLSFLIYCHIDIRLDIAHSNIIVTK